MAKARGLYGGELLMTNAELRKQAAGKLRELDSENKKLASKLEEKENTLRVADQKCEAYKVAVDLSVAGEIDGGDIHDKVALMEWLDNQF